MRKPSQKANKAYDMKKIKIMPEYGCSPLWLYDSNNIVKNIEISELSISERLKNDIHLWAGRYESTFDEGYPPDSGFSNVSDEEAFELEGIAIWEKLQKEGHLYYNVSFFSTLVGKVFENIHDYRKAVSSHTHYIL